MAKIDFVKSLQTAQLERDVEQVYNNGISLYFPNVDIEHPFACDGLITTKEQDKLLKLIIEYKFDENFISKFVRAKVITQVIYYIKQIENAGMILPNVVLVGDKNECFCFHTNCIIKYLDYKCDWSIAPSRAGLVNMDMVNAIAGDDEVNPFVFDIKEGFDFENVVEKIKELACNVQRYVHITEHNIATIYETFVNRVVRNQKKLSSDDLVGVFMGVITNGEEYYKHPTKKNLLVTPNKNIEIDSRAFDAFFSYFQRTYTPQEKNNFAAIADRLIEDTDRRNSGDFFTPTIFTDFAHKMISEQLGENWKDEYVVYDMAAGSGNLTRDYRFGELYCSTLFESELEIGKRYNQEATKFQFDFLNDYFPMKGDLHNTDSKVPAGLIKALKENRKIVFLLNPPYGTSANKFGADGTDKKNIAKTAINEIMLKDGIGACSQNLYAQFLYRISIIKRNYNLTNLYIGLFSPSLFLSGGSYKKFREQFLSDFGYMGGFLFCASEFADCASNWGINFTMWKCGETADKENFVMNIIERGKEGELEIKGRKVVYNVDNSKPASDWAKEDIKKLKTFDCPNVSSAIIVRSDNSDTRGKNFDNNIGYFLNAGNNIDMNMQKVSLFSTAYGNGHGHGISKDNFTKCTSLFSARKLIEKDWINSKDEYIAPNEMHPNYREFELDSVIYSLFNTSSNQSSLRNVEYKGKQWDIYNEFFFMSKSDMELLGNENGNDVCYIGAHTSKERFVYSYLQLHRKELSAEALRVLEKAEELVRESFKYRAMFDEEKPEYQINNWDCGWYQIKGLLKMYCPDELKGFQELYKALSDKMRPMVYELGFLKK